jgi:hypothetical protein
MRAPLRVGGATHWQRIDRRRLGDTQAVKRPDADIGGK